MCCLNVYSCVSYLGRTGTNCKDCNKTETPSALRRHDAQQSNQFWIAIIQSVLQYFTYDISMGTHLPWSEVRTKFVSNFLWRSGWAAPDTSSTNVVQPYGGKVYFPQIERAVGSIVGVIFLEPKKISKGGKSQLLDVFSLPMCILTFFTTCSIICHRLHGARGRRTIFAKVLGKKSVFSWFCVFWILKPLSNSQDSRANSVVTDVIDWSVLPVKILLLLLAWRGKKRGKATKKSTGWRTFDGGVAVLLQVIIDWKVVS